MLTYRISRFPARNGVFQIRGPSELDPNNHTLPDLIVCIKTPAFVAATWHHYSHGNNGSNGRVVVPNPLILRHKSTGLTSIGNVITFVKFGDKICLEPGSSVFCVEIRPIAEG
ncbi:hypothetical protein V1506DRAFT_196269 [Lipomyces tetrasporus]